MNSLAFDKSADRFGTAVFWLTLVTISIIICARFLYIASLSDADLVMYMPDDAFYYLNLARNHAQHGWWTFDGGSSGATGFHLLQGYQTALIARLSPQNAPLIAASFTTIAALLTVFTTLAGIRYLYGNRLAALCFPVFTAYPFVAGSSSGMEWGWCILTSSALFLIVATTREIVTNRQLSFCFALGLLLELSRSDAGVITGSLFVSAWLVRAVHNSKVQQNIVLCTLTALLGSILGLILTLVHTWVLRGSLASGSSEVKLAWAQHAGTLNCVRNAYRTFLQVLGVPRDLTGLWLAICAIAVIAILLRYVFKEVSSWRRMAEKSDATTLKKTTQATLLLASVLACLAFFALFSMNAAVLFWYCALITVPLTFILIGSYRLIQKNGSLATRIVANTALASATLYGLTNIANPTDPHQKHMHNAALQMAKDYPNQRFGAWNAGIFGYFSPIGNVVNLDGLVNDKAIPYIKNNTLTEYIRKENLKLIVDFTPMITEKSAQRKGGYDTDDFRESVKKVKDISPKTDFIGSSIGVFAFE